MKDEWRKENIATLAITGLTMCGLYALGAGGHSFWPIFFLLNLSYPTRRKS